MAKVAGRRGKSAKVAGRTGQTAKVAGRTETAYSIRAATFAVFTLLPATFALLTRRADRYGFLLNSTFGASLAPGFVTSKYSRDFAPVALAVITCGNFRMYAL